MPKTTLPFPPGDYAPVADRIALFYSRHPEGRIVTAGARSDQGDNAGAVRLLAQGFTFPKRPKEHHLRRAYALADLFERAGDVTHARDLFERIQRADARFGDVNRRLKALK